MSSGGRGGTARPRNGRGGGQTGQNNFHVNTVASRGGRGGKYNRDGSIARQKSGGHGGLAQTGGALTTPAASKPGDTAGGPLQERLDMLKVLREQERQNAINNGLMNDPNKQIALEKAVTMVGTCQEMCAEYERVERARANEVAEEEKDETGAMDESRMVRKFHRPAAGYEPPGPSDLRPPPVLKRVCQYLFNEVIGDDANLGWLAKRHTFLWDRTRAVRNDFSIQQVNKVEDLKYGIDCFECIVRFHIQTIHAFTEPDRPPPGKYDAKQDREQMDKALLSLMQYYDDSRGRYESPNEPEFRAYCILFEIQSRTPDLEDRVQMWPRRIVSDPRVQTALKLHAAATNTTDNQGPLSGTPQLIGRQDWNQFWQLIRSGKVSYLMACVAETYFNHVRRIALQAIVRTTRKGRKDHPALLEWSIDRIRPYFCFDNDVQLEEFLGCYGLEFKVNEGIRYLEVSRFASSSLPEPNRQPTGYKSRLVEEKRQSRTIPAIIYGLSVRQAREAGKLIEEPESEYGKDEQMADEGQTQEDMSDEDDGSLFIPERKVEETAPVQQKKTEALAVTETPAATATAATAPTNGFNFAVPKVTTGSPFAPSPFGQTSTNPFGQKPQSTGMFGQPTDATTNPTSAPKFDFGGLASKPNATFPPTTTSPFSFPSSTTTTSAPVATGLGISSNNASPKPSLSNGFVQSSSTASSSPFASSVPADAPTTKPTAAEPSRDFFNLGNSATTVPATSAPEQTNQSAFSWSQASGSVNPAPSMSVQLEPNSKSAPTSSAAQTNATSTAQTSHTAHDPGASTISSGSLSPTRRQSINHAQDTRPKRPSPLSNSFTAEDGPVFDETKAAKAAVKQPSRELPSKRTPAATQAPPAQSPPASSEFNVTVARLANELTFDPVSGLLKQWVQQHTRNVISQVQQNILQERLEERLQEFCRRRSERIANAFFVKWRQSAHVKGLRKKGNEKRDRTRLRYLRTEVEQGRLDPGILDKAQSRSSSRASSVIPRSKAAEHQRVDAMFRSTNRGRRSAADDQARAGSKRPASALDGEMPPPPVTNGHKRAKSSSQVEDDNSTTQHAVTSNPHADLLKRSSFLGFSLPSDAPRASTTKTSYFRLKAMGLKPVPDTDTVRGTKRSRSDSLDAASAKLEESRFASSVLRQSSERASNVRPPSARSDRSKVNEEDEALFARLKAAREALKDGENFMRSEVRGEELRRSRSASRSDADSPSMERARAEARLHASTADLEYSASAVSSRDVPAYRLRESRFVPREQYGRAIERANEFRASRSRETSRPTSRTDNYDTEGPGPSKLSLGGSSQQLDKDEPRKAESKSSLNGNGTKGASAFSGVDPKPTFPAQTSKPAFGFGSQSAFGSQTQPSHQPNVANPFSQSSSFATVSPNYGNPFLQATAPGASTTTPLSQPQAPATITAPNPFLQNSASASSWGVGTSKQSNISTQAQQSSFGFGFSQSSKPADRTVPPEQIPNELSNSFGPTTTAGRSPFAPTTHGSPTPPQTGSYMPSHAASEAISLLSDDDDTDDGEQMPHGQEEFFNAVPNAADFEAGISFPDDDGAGDFDLASQSVPHNGYSGQYAALADYDEEEEPGVNEELEQDDAPEEYGVDSDDNLAAEEQEDADEQDPDSYQYGDVVDDDELEDDDELPHGHYRDYSEESSGDQGAEGEEGDVEDFDEGGYDGEGYDDEEEDMDGQTYANNYRSHAEYQAMSRKLFQPPQPNPALQGVGNDEDNAIELSD